MKDEQIYQILEKAYFGENADESQEIKDLDLILVPNSKLFIDVGASLGQYTKRANEIMKGGRIIAIEADPIRFKRLLQLSKQWMKNSSNTIEIIHAAISNTSGTTDFFITNSNFSGALSKREIQGVDNWKKIQINCLTLDEVCGGEKPDLVKIDIEGGELNAILGAKNLLECDAKFLLEIHQDSTTINDILVGYSCKKFYNHYLYKKDSDDENIYNYLQH